MPDPRSTYFFPLFSFGLVGQLWIGRQTIVFGGAVPVFFAGRYKNYCSGCYYVFLVFGGYGSFAFGDYEDLLGDAWVWKFVAGT